MDNTQVQVRKGHLTTKHIVVIGLLSAMAFVLMFLKFPIKFIGFLELEISDVPAIVCGLVYGPVAGVFVELIKNILHLAATSTVAVGELANFIMSSCFVLGISLVYRLGRSSKRLFIGFVVGTLALIISGVLVNYFITLPMYIQLYFGGNEQVLYQVAGAMVPAIKDMKTILAFGFIPFNLVKGVIVSIVGYYVFKLLKNRIA